MNECSKSIYRRMTSPNFMNKYFVGVGIDIGGGSDSLAKYSYVFPLIISVKNFDKIDGNALNMSDYSDNDFDFVHSSHCLEHLDDPFQGLQNWLRIIKPGGHLIVTVPDEDMYEQGIFPSTWSNEHKWTFTVFKKCSWSEKSINLLDLLTRLNDVKIEKIELLNATYNNSISERVDQTYDSLITESCIEFVIQKL